MVFVCENNLYGEYSPIATHDAGGAAGRSGRQLCDGRGRAIDGNDVVAVRRAALEALDRARRGDGPTLIEALTYRWSGHSRSDPAKYRPPGELESWQQRDPIKRLREQLRDEGVTAEDCDRVAAAAEAAVAEALERAKGWPEPDLDSRLTDVYA